MTKPSALADIAAERPPLTTAYFFADPAAHVWESTAQNESRVYIYSSHDAPEVVRGSGLTNEVPIFRMVDYHVLSTNLSGGDVRVHPVALRVEDIPWAGSRLWAPDAARRNGTFFLYFPAMTPQGQFRIGVATSRRPEGPFDAQPHYIPGSYSIDPSVFADDNGDHYLYFGGIWGGQLHRWEGGAFDASPERTRDSGRGAAISPRVALLADDMMHFAEEPSEVVIVDADGKPLRASNHERRFFEAPWLHKHAGRYFFSYSTGDTHRIVYATGDSPRGPFRYRGVLAAAVQGWTHHHSIARVRHLWMFFFHDAARSGKDHLRDIRQPVPLVHTPNGSLHLVLRAAHGARGS